MVTDEAVKDQNWKLAQPTKILPSLLYALYSILDCHLWVIYF